MALTIKEEAGAGGTSGEVEGMAAQTGLGKLGTTRLVQSQRAESTTIDVQDPADAMATPILIALGKKKIRPQAEVGQLGRAKWEQVPTTEIAGKRRPRSEKGSEPIVTRKKAGSPRTMAAMTVVVQVMKDGGLKRAGHGGHVAIVATHVPRSTWTIRKKGSHPPALA